MAIWHKLASSHVVASHSSHVMLCHWSVIGVLVAACRGHSDSSCGGGCCLGIGSLSPTSSRLIGSCATTRRAADISPTFSELTGLWILAPRSLLWVPSFPVLRVRHCYFSSIWCARGLPSSSSTSGLTCVAAWPAALAPGRQGPMGLAPPQAKWPGSAGASLDWAPSSPLTSMGSLRFTLAVATSRHSTLCSTRWSSSSSPWRQTELAWVPARPRAMVTVFHSLSRGRRSGTCLRRGW